MEQRQALLVINPVAGTRSKQGLEEVVSRRLEEVGVSVKTVRTSGSGDAAEREFVTLGRKK